MSVDRQPNPEPDYEQRFLLVQAEALARAGHSPSEIEHALKQISAYAEAAARATRLASPHRLAGWLRHRPRGSHRDHAHGVEGAISLEPETGRP